MSERPPRQTEGPAGRALRDPDETKSDKRRLQRRSAGDGPTKHDADKDRHRQRNHDRYMAPKLGKGKERRGENKNDNQEEEHDDEGEADAETFPRIIIPSTETFREYFVTYCPVVLKSLEEKPPADIDAAKDDALRQAKDAAKKNTSKTGSKNAVVFLITYQLLSQWEATPELKADKLLNSKVMPQVLTTLQHLYKTKLASTDQASLSTARSTKKPAQETTRCETHAATTTPSTLSLPFAGTGSRHTVSSSQPVDRSSSLQSTVDTIQDDQSYDLISGAGRLQDTTLSTPRSHKVPSDSTPSDSCEDDTTQPTSTSDRIELTHRHRPTKYNPDSEE